MKLNKEDLSGVVIVATNTIVNSLSTLSFILKFNKASPEMMESLLINMPYFTKSVNFAESVLDNLTDNAKSQVTENLEIIKNLAAETSKQVSEMYSNE